MKVTLFMLVLLLGSADGQKNISFPAADGQQVHGVLYANPEARAVLLLFHQSWSNHAEYAPIAPRFVKLGFVVLATDQRYGGSMYGERNLTFDAYPGVYTFEEVLPDLEGAVQWSRKAHPGKPIWLMGSSYSAALVFVVAAKHPEVKAVLAFSPAEYLRDGQAVREAARTLKQTSVFLTGMHTASEILGCQQVYDALPSRDKTMFIPHKLGTHAANILRPEMKQLGGAEVWSAVTHFVKTHLP
ncbi:alpha/beta hydrolase [Deinococcus cellulosilyticus]|uniref:Serine aminopeptidase S33 domain-containing protein n=1 Tax=Deinococcus cellulosilyticus (strain DSM 18568 / NBRC 106333 / KACC 11606 / 5516J-15) TaxID=1223518 RepID=A0A511N7X1_DEIC1|nr:alpha/beta fold hydrolase [Deinococcus cellulosilyticus]GEM48576.1 hypothetical protein DC3_42110 [Deinococcus cellulosilyticus NBRC 106333 = KACC 11606]